MSIEEMLSAARNRLATIRDDARLIDAARLLTHAHVNLVVVCDRDGVLTGVITRTDVVRQISGCAGQSCMTAAAAAKPSETARTLTARDLMGSVYSQGRGPSKKPRGKNRGNHPRGESLKGGSPSSPGTGVSGAFSAR